MNAQFGLSCLLLCGKQVFQVLARIISIVANVGTDEATFKLSHSDVTVLLHVDDGAKVHGHLTACSGINNTVILHLDAYLFAHGKLAKRFLCLPGVSL